MEEEQTPLQSPPIHTHIHTQQSPNSPTQMQENNTNNSRTRYSSLISTFRFLQAPLSSLVSHYFPIPQNPNPNFTFSNESETNNNNGGGATEVSIQIMTDHDSNQSDNDDNDGGGGELRVNELSRNTGVGEIGIGEGEGEDQSLIRESSGVEQNVGSGGDDSGSSSLYEHRYDLQQAARLIERVIPFSFLLLLVFIRQHLQGIVLIFVILVLALS